MKPKIGVCKPYMLIHEVNLVLSQTLRNRNIEIQSNLCSRSKKAILTDGTRLQQVYFNLMQNAIKGSHNFGNIYVKCKVYEKQLGSAELHLSVKDYGTPLTWS
jgi:signal transduction histidine kinase